MMEKKKTMNLTSLASSEEKDLRRLSAFAIKGWHLEQVKVPFFSYQLNYELPLISDYMIDFNDQINQEYFDNYKKKGWTYVCSNGHLHYFKATKNTPRFYTDEIAKANVYLAKSKQFGLIFVIMFLASFGAGFSFSQLSNTVDPNVTAISLLFIFAILLGMGALLMLFAAWTTHLKGSKIIKYKETHGTKNSKNK